MQVLTQGDIPYKLNFWGANNMRLAITGNIRAGKDTFAEYFIKDLGFEQFTFAEGIHDVVGHYFPHAYKDGKPREYLQVIGQAFRQLDADIWVRTLDEELQKHYSWYPQPENANVIITDLRQPNELAYLKANGFYVVRVEADFDKRVKRATESGDNFNIESFHHETEKNVSKLIVDYSVTNNDTIEDLHEKAKWVYGWVKNNAK